MAKLENKTKENPKLEQIFFSPVVLNVYLGLAYHLGREETPVLDENGNPVLYEIGKMVGKPKVHIKHNRRKENLQLYLMSLFEPVRDTCCTDSTSMALLEPETVISASAPPSMWLLEPLTMLMVVPAGTDTCSLDSLTVRVPAASWAAAVGAAAGASEEGTRKRG